MKKGISPIIAVVLLIAIAVIAAVGVYFWVGGIATKQPTPNPPIVINAIVAGIYKVGDTETTEILVQNLGSRPLTTKCLQTSEGWITNDGFHAGLWCVMLNTTSQSLETKTIKPGEQAPCVLLNQTKATLSGYSNVIHYTKTIALYGKGTSSVTLQLTNSPVMDTVTYTDACA